MANCSACEAIRHTDPDFVVNGFDEDNCTSLQNDTGIAAVSGHDDATDLNDINDCFIGNLDDEVEKYDVCDWKEFMHILLPNLWTMFAALICAIKGLWTNVHNLWTNIQNILADLESIHQDITAINGSITTLNNGMRIVNNSINTINTQIGNMPKDIIYADVSTTVNIVSGYDAQNHVDIDASRTDGYVPKGIVGWNFDNAGSSTGVSAIYPFQVKLHGTTASFQLYNTSNETKRVLVAATILYVKG